MPWAYNPFSKRFDYYDEQDLSGYAKLDGAEFTGNISAQNLSGDNTGDETASGIKDKLETLTGEDRLDASAIKNIDGAVTGPASSVNNHVVFFDGITGKIIKDSGLTLIGDNTGDQDLSGLLPKSGGAMIGVLTYASPQVLNMQPVDAEPDAADMVEGCIYFVAEDV